MANNLSWEEKDSVNDGNGETNTQFKSHFEFIATKTIKAGDEIIYDYNLTSG